MLYVDHVFMKFILINRYDLHWKQLINDHFKYLIVVDIPQQYKCFIKCC